MSARRLNGRCPTHGCFGGIFNARIGLCVNCHRDNQERAMTKPLSIGETVRAPSWEGAACTTADPELFFAPDGERAYSRDFTMRVAAAQRVCAACPISDACLTYAIEAREVGVWSGTHDDQRTAMRVKRGATA